MTEEQKQEVRAFVERVLAAQDVRVEMTLENETREIAPYGDHRRWQATGRVFLSLTIKATEK